MQGVQAYPSIDKLPERVDLAVLIIPARFVPEELERCGRAGVKAALVLASGFADDANEDGAARASFDERLEYATLIAPKLTIQGGTTEVLRGIVARGLGLR